MAKGKSKAASAPAPVQDEEMAQLRASLAAHNDSFSTLLSMIPAKQYLSREDLQMGLYGETADDESGVQGKLSKKQRKQLKAENAEAAKELALAKRQAKKAKYDPDTPRTVIEIQQAKAAAEAEAAGTSKSGKSAKKASAALVNGAPTLPKPVVSRGKATAPPAVNGEDEDEDSPNDTDFEDDVDDEDEPAAAPVKSTRAPASLMNGVLAKVGAAATAEASPEPTSRDALLEERRRKRGEVRDKRREKVKARKRKEREDPTLAGDRKRKREDEGSALPPTASIGKVGAMSDVKKALKKEGRKQPSAPSADDDEMDVAPSSSSRAVVRAPAQPKPSTSATAGPSSSSAGELAFSSLNFAGSNSIAAVDAPKLSKKAREAMSKSTKLGVTSHDPSVALGALQKREEFLSKLTPQARERAEEKDKWERMAMKAEGTKVYDEEAKLKKMVKRKEKAKDKSRKDWADRKETAANAQAAQQKKRQENINSRLQAKKDKKLGVKPKKSIGKPNPKKKGRPGFEGKGGGSSKSSSGAGAGKRK